MCRRGTAQARNCAPRPSSDHDPREEPVNNRNSIYIAGLVLIIGAVVAVWKVTGAGAEDKTAH